MAIYPTSITESKPFVLTDIEKDALKKGYVVALEENIIVDQDKALRALELAEFKEDRVIEIKQNLWQIFGLEAELVSEVEGDKKDLEAAFAEGTKDAEALETAITCKAVDAAVFADRFVKIKNGETVTDPVLPVKIAPKEIIKEGDLSENL